MQRRAGSRRASPAAPRPAAPRLGSRRRRLLVEVAAHLRRLEPAAAGVARVLQDGEAELDLGIGKRRRRADRRGRGRQLEGLGLEPPVVGLGDLRHGVARAGRKAVGRHPDRRGSFAIERHGRGTVRRHDAAQLRCPELLAHLGHERIELDHRRSGGGVCARRRSGRPPPSAAGAALASSAGARPRGAAGLARVSLRRAAAARSARSRLRGSSRVARPMRSGRATAPRRWRSGWLARLMQAASDDTLNIVSSLQGTREPSRHRQP